MRTTLNIDDRLLAEAQRITGIAEKAKLGGSEPQLKSIPRRRTKLT